MDLLIFFVIIVLAALIIDIGIPMLAESDLFFTTLREGTGKFIEAGEDVKMAIFNVPGWSYNMEKDLLEPSEGNDPDLGFIHRRYGVVWIGLPWIVNVKEWQQSWARPELENSTLTMKTHNAVTVKELFAVSMVGLVLENLETKDDWKATVPIGIQLRAIKPRYLVYTLNGKYLVNPLQTISGALADFINQRTYEELKSVKKHAFKEDALTAPNAPQKGPDLPKESLREYILSLNSEIFKSNTGLEIIDIFYEGFELSNDQAEAVRQKSLAREKKLADIEKAAGEKALAAVPFDVQNKAYKDLIKMSDGASSNAVSILLAQLQSKATENATTVVYGIPPGTLLPIPTNNTPTEVTPTQPTAPANPPNPQAAPRTNPS